MDKKIWGIMKRRFAIKINVISLIIFLVLLVMVKMNLLISDLDIWIDNSLLKLRSDEFTSIFMIVTRLGDWYSMLTISVVVISILIYKRKRIETITFSFGMILGFILETLIKNLVQRPRPINSLVLVSGYSFPSGHATMIALLVLLICYLYRNKILYFFSLIIILTVGLSRLYLHAHWLSDVISGYILAIYTFSISTILEDHLDQIEFLS